MRSITVVLLEASVNNAVPEKDRVQTLLSGKLDYDTDYVDPIVEFGKSKFRLNELILAVNSLSAFYGMESS